MTKVEQDQRRVCRVRRCALASVAAALAALSGCVFETGPGSASSGSTGSGGSRSAAQSIEAREEAFQIPDLIRTKINLLPPEIQIIRIVDIVGLDLQADGGTHVRDTREVGGVQIIKTENKGKQNKRMEIALVD